MKNNFIVNQKAKNYEWAGECFLSVKSFFNGKATYQVKQREYQVDETNFLLLNECTNYRLTIDSVQPTESFCVFFSPDFVSSVVSDLHSKDEPLLDFMSNKQDGIKLLEQNYAFSGRISDLLKVGKVKFGIGMSDLEKDEFYHVLLTAIIQENNKSLIRTDKLSHKKKSTRTEVYQRVLYVKDFIDANYTSNLRLNDLSRIGLLSENYLLKNFNQLFGVSPFQYISQKRLEEARRQVQYSNKAIKDIASDVGYSSFNNFSTYFKSVFGKSPTAYRKSDM